MAQIYRKTKAFEVLKETGTVLKQCSKKLLENRDFILEVLREKPDEITALSEVAREWLGAPEVILKLLGLDSSLGVDERSYMQYAAETLKNNEDFMKRAVRISPKALREASTAIRRNAEVAEIAVEQDVKALFFVDQECPKYEEIVKKAVKKDAIAINFVAPERLKSKPFMVELLKENARILSYMSRGDLSEDVFLAVFKDNPDLIKYIVGTDSELLKSVEIARAVVEKNPEAYEYFSKDVKKNHEVVKILLKHSPEFFTKLDKVLQKDKDFVLSCIEDNYELFGFTLDFQKDPEFVKEVLKKIEETTEPGEERLNAYHFIAVVLMPREDEKIDKKKKEDLKKFALTTVLELVAKDEKLLEILAKTGLEEYVNNKKFISSILNTNKSAIKFAGESLRNDAEFISSQIKKHGVEILDGLESGLLNNEEFMRATLETYPKVIKYIGNELKKDRVFMKGTLTKRPELLRDASDDIKQDKDLIADLVETNPEIFKFVANDLKKDREYIKELVVINPSVFEHIDDELRSDGEYIIDLIAQSPKIYNYINDKLKNDDFLIELIKVNNEVFDILSEDKKGNKEFVKAAVSEIPLLYKRLDESWQKDEDIALAAVASDVEIFKDIIIKDKSFVERAIKANYQVFGRIAPEDREQYYDAVVELFGSMTSEDEKAVVFGEFLALKDQKLIIKLLETNGDFLSNLSGSLLNDADFMSKLADVDVRLLSKLGEDLKKDSQFFTDLINAGRGEALQFAGKQVINNQGIIDLAVSKNAELFKFAGAKLKKDKKFVSQLAVQHPEIVAHIGKSLKSNKRFAMQLVVDNPKTLQYLQTAKFGENFILQALNKNSAVKDVLTEEQIALPKVGARIKQIEFFEKALASVSLKSFSAEDIDRLGKAIGDKSDKDVKDMIRKILPYCQAGSTLKDLPASELTPEIKLIARTIVSKQAAAIFKLKNHEDVYGKNARRKVAIKYIKDFDKTLKIKEKERQQQLLQAKKDERKAQKLKKANDRKLARQAKKEARANKGKIVEAEVVEPVEEIAVVDEKLLEKVRKNKQKMVNNTLKIETGDFSKDDKIGLQTQYWISADKLNASLDEVTEALSKGVAGVQSFAVEKLTFRTRQLIIEVAKKQAEKIVALRDIGNVVWAEGEREALAEAYLQEVEKKLDARVEARKMEKKLQRFEKDAKEAFESARKRNKAKEKVSSEERKTEVDVSAGKPVEDEAGKDSKATSSKKSKIAEKKTSKGKGAISEEEASDVESSEITKPGEKPTKKRERDSKTDMPPASR